MKLRFLPISRLGKWSVIMMVINWILFVLGSVLPWESGYSGFAFIFHNPVQGIITVLMLAVGIASIIMAIVSIIKNKERSVLVFLAIITGMFSVLGFVGSIANLFSN